MALLFPYPEYGFWGNLIGIGLMYAIALVVYYVIKPLMLKFIEKRNGSIDLESEVPLEEYWKEELQGK